jgi:hypothetical protein
MKNVSVTTWITKSGDENVKAAPFLLKEVMEDF